MMNKFMIITLVFTMSLKTYNVAAGGPLDPAIDHTFNYQGELLNSNNPVSGLYDFTIEAFTDDSGDISLGNSFERIKVTVTNGIFTINDIDLGDITDGFSVYLEISVRENGAGATYEKLLPRTKIQSVPYATKLISGDAQEDQVLTFANGEWGPKDIPASQSDTPWTTDGTDINYTAGNVGIGIQDPTSALHVKRTDVGLAAQFDGGDSAVITVLENGSPRGFAGSLGIDIADNDFAVGSTLADLHLIAGGFSSPSLSIKQKSGDVGINTTSPQADFHIEGSVGGDLLRIRLDGTTKLRVRDNGGTAIGTLANPPENGLFVAGDVQQSVNSNGFMKYMVSVVNCGNVNVSIQKSYNGVDAGAITPQNDAGGIGTCEILFTQNISERFIMATETSGVARLGNSVSCTHLGNNGVSCVVFDSDGNETLGDVDLLIY